MQKPNGVILYEGPSLLDGAPTAQRLGWRTFRVGMQPRNEVSKAMLNEVLCPASEQAGKKLTCSQCLACGGADGRRGSIWIPAHGGFAVMANVRRFAGIPITTV